MKFIYFFDFSIFLKKLICFRSIKFCIFKLLKYGFEFRYFDFCIELDILNSLFLNIYLNGIESVLVYNNFIFFKYYFWFKLIEFLY